MNLNGKALWIRTDGELKSLILTIEQVCESEQQLPKAKQNPIFYHFFNTFIIGAELLCENISPFKPFCTHRYASQILCLEEIHETMDLVPDQLLLDARKPKQELQDFYQELQPEDMSSMLEDSISCKQDSMITNDAFHNTKLLQQMRLDDFCENSEIEEGFNYSVHDIAAVKSLGLEKSIEDLKGLLFKNELSIVGVRCMEDDGKTTLELAICYDNLVEVLSGAGYKTVSTTTESSTIPRNHSIQLYQLSLLGQEDAVSLSCFWAFGQMSIPSNADANLVNEVQAECRGLPLALKVIGSCLHGEPRAAWKRKLEWGEAFAILISNPRSAAAISYGNASELCFSQHGVVRDLALYLEGQGIAFQRNELLMPRKENIVPGTWVLLKDRPFNAQIVSVHTGSMDKSEWHENNSPKTMLLFAASEYNLPSFINSR